MTTSGHSRIWMTGSGGFIGSHTARVLGSVCSELRCFTNRVEAVSSAGSPFPRLFMDFSSEGDIRRNIDTFGLPDIFIHMAWAAMTDPGSEEHLTTNVETGKRLISTLYAAGLKKFIFIGSANEYGAREGSLAEDMPAVGRMTNYAKAKAEVASFGLRQATEHGATFISVRPFYVFGPGQRSGSLINKLYGCRQAGSKVDLGPCEHYRDYIYVGEVAEGIRRICDVNECTTVNLGSGSVIQLKDFVSLFWRMLGGRPDDLSFGANPMRAGEPEQPLAYASLDRLRRLTNWSPSLTVAEGIGLTIDALLGLR